MKLDGVIGFWGLETRILDERSFGRVRQTADMCSQLTGGKIDKVLALLQRRHTSLHPASSIQILNVRRKNKFLAENLSCIKTNLDHLLLVSSTCY